MNHGGNVLLHHAEEESLSRLTAIAGVVMAVVGLGIWVVARSVAWWHHG